MVRRAEKNRPRQGARLVESCEAAGLSRAEFAAKLEISQRMVAYYEGETDYPPAHLLPALAHPLGVSTDELLEVKTIKSKANWHCGTVAVVDSNYGYQICVNLGQEDNKVTALRRCRVSNEIEELAFSITFLP